MAKSKAPPRPQRPPAAPHEGGGKVRTRGVSVGLLPVAFIAGAIVVAVTIIYWFNAHCHVG